MNDQKFAAYCLAHTLCPQCGSDDVEQDEAYERIAHLSKQFRNRKKATCRVCNWVGIVHDLTAAAQPVVRDEFTAEVVAEIRDLLAKLQAQAVTLIPASMGEFMQGLSSLAQQEQQQALQSILARLAYLLSLSPAERAFVQEAADANRSGDLAGADNGLAIFADWLEDEGRAADGKRVRRLLLEDGDVVVLQLARNAIAEINATEAMSQGLRKQMLEVGKNVGFVTLAVNQTIERIGREQMRQAGWVRVEDLDADVGNATNLLQEEIDRLEAENKLIREQIKSVERPISSLLLSQLP